MAKALDIRNEVEAARWLRASPHLAWTFQISAIDGS
jgi:hypothetical protein